jgi:hypothetical protein
MRAVLAGHPLDWGSMGIAFGLDAIYIAIAIAIFAQTFAYAKAQGLLAKTGE